MLNASNPPSDLQKYLTDVEEYSTLTTDQLKTVWSRSTIQAGYYTWRASQTEFSSGMDVSPEDLGLDSASVMDDNDDDNADDDASTSRSDSGASASDASTSRSGDGAPSSTNPVSGDDAETSATAADARIDEATNLIVELVKLFSDDNRAKIQEAFNDNPYPDNISKKSRSLGRLGKAKREKNKAREKDKARHAHLKKMKKGEHNPAMKNKNSRGKKDKKDKRTESQALAVGRYKN